MASPALTNARNNEIEDAGIERRGAVARVDVVVADDGTDVLIHRLSGENLALQSVLYGLCMGLSQMSDVHREVVAQAFEYAYSAPRGGPANVGEQATRVREQAFRDAVGRLKEA